MRRGPLVLFLAMTATACTKHDEALESVARAQVIDLRNDTPRVAWTYHVERRGARWAWHGTLERPPDRVLPAGKRAADETFEAPALERFLRAVAASRRGTPPAAPPGSPGTLKMTILAATGTPPIVLERKDGARWSVNGDPLAEPALLDEPYRAMTKELGIDGRIEWAEHGPAY